MHRKYFKRVKKFLINFNHADLHICTFAHLHINL
jgi:hypothetical protein